jgi:uncharacterized protein (DUF2237 family)
MRKWHGFASLFVPILFLGLMHSTQSNTASDRAGHNTRPMCSGLLPEQQWCLCASSNEDARLGSSEKLF